MTADEIVNAMCLRTGASREAVIKTALSLLGLSPTEISSLSNKPKYKTIQELADEWGCSYLFVYKLVKSGKLDAVKIGKEWKVKPEDAEKIVERMHWGDRRVRFK